MTWGDLEKVAYELTLKELQRVSEEWRQALITMREKRK